MKNKDDIGLFEAYNQVVDPQQLIEEGWWDRLKARTSGVAGGAKPMERIGAGVASGLGKIAGKFSPEAGKSLQQVGAEGRKKIAAAGQTSKITSILNSKRNSINKLANDIINDLNKLGLNSKGMTSDDVSKSLLNDIETMLTGQLGSATSATSTKTSASPKGKPTTQHFASDIGASGDSMYQKYNDGWYEREGSKASGFTFSKVSDQNIINALEKLP
jgi:hypothetical protein